MLDRCRRHSTYGLFVLNVVLLPGERIPLHIFEPRYRQLFADCVLEDTPFVVVYSEDDAAATVGCAARFEELIERHADGRISVMARSSRPLRSARSTTGTCISAPSASRAPMTPCDVDGERSARPRRGSVRSPRIDRPGARVPAP